MGVAIQQPDDVMKLPYHMNHRKSFSPNQNRSNRAQQLSRKKRSPITSSLTPPSAVPRVPSKHLVMGQVKIPKRGEELKNPTPSKSVTFKKENDGADMVLTQNRDTESTNNGHDDKTVIPSSFYAGSAFSVTSPPPTSVPIPAFFTKKVLDATSDLRRILRLDS